MLGGATLDEPITEGKGPKINGSVMMALAESRERELRKSQESRLADVKADAERKVAAFMQQRFGPSLVGPRGLLQPAVPTNIDIRA